MLLTPAEVGSGWHSEGAEPLEIDEPEEMGGRCRAGSSFTPPAFATFIDFEPPDQSGDNTIAEGLLTFDSRDGLDAWTAAMEWVHGEPWEEGGDPIEHVSLETIDVADHGDDHAGFLSPLRTVKVRRRHMPAAGSLSGWAACWCSCRVRTTTWKTQRTRNC